ncbi:hypothetical protein IW150_007380, partial [Coemansia sp. RSA 2607]
AHYHGPSGGAAHTFARQLTSRLLACASSGSEADARAVLECVWTRMHMLTQQGSTDGAALSGMVAAVESTCYRFTAQDVAQADALLAHGVAGHTLVVVRAVLESRLGERLVAAGALDGAAAQQSGPQELWNAVAQLTSPCGTLPTLADDEVRAYEHMLEASLLAFDEACGEHVMRLSLYAAALSSMLLGRAEPRVTDAMAAHIRGAQAYRLRGVTQTCLRVLAAQAAFFGSGAVRASATTLATAFVTAPAQCLVDALPQEGDAAADERALLDPAADALLAAERPWSGVHVQSRAHALFGSLATTGDALSARSVRVARNVAVVLTRMATTGDASLAALVVGMLCAPRFAQPPELLALTLQCAAEVAPLADRAV